MARRRLDDVGLWLLRRSDNTKDVNKWMKDFHKKHGPKVFSFFKYPIDVNEILPHYHFLAFLGYINPRLEPAAYWYGLALHYPEEYQCLLEIFGFRQLTQPVHLVERHQRNLVRLNYKRLLGYIPPGFEELPYNPLDHMQRFDMIRACELFQAQGWLRNVRPEYFKRYVFPFGD